MRPFFILLLFATILSIKMMFSSYYRTLFVAPKGIGNYSWPHMPSSLPSIPLGNYSWPHMPTSLPSVPLGNFSWPSMPNFASALRGAAQRVTANNFTAP